MDNSAIFNEIYRKNIWGDSDSKSGTGSNLRQTENIRKQLPSFLNGLNIKTILDIPCGDFYWMPLIDLDNISYFGADIVDDLIKLNEKKFKEPNLKFLKLDIIQDELPEVDFKEVQKNFREIDNNYTKFKIDLSGVEVIFILENSYEEEKPIEEPIVIKKEGFIKRLIKNYLK